VVRFELFVNAMRVGIAAHFQKGGLKPPVLTYALTGHPAVTARPLSQMYVTVIATLYPDPDLQKFLKWFEGEATGLSEKRNDLVHATWLFDLARLQAAATAPEWPELEGMKFHPSRRSIVMKPLPQTTKEVEALCARADLLASLCLNLDRALLISGDWRRGVMQNPEAKGEWKPCRAELFAEILAGDEQGATEPTREGHAE
jgi:hypothetical protein